MIYILSFQRLQEESDSWGQQREQESLLAALCQTLKEEAEAKQLRVEKQVSGWSSSPTTTVPSGLPGSDTTHVGTFITAGYVDVGKHCVLPDEASVPSVSL